MAGSHNIPRIRVRPRELQHMPVKLRRTGSAADELADNQSQTQKVRLQGRQDIRNNRYGLCPRGRLQEHIHDKFRNNDRGTERRHRIFGANFVHLSRAHVLRSSQPAVRHRPCRELYCELVLPLKFNIDTSRYTAAKACVFCRGIFDRFFICENIK